jgi:hypothetical protein
MEHIQQLTMTGLRPRAARTDARPQVAAPTELPSRERIRRVAELHHRQLVQAKQRTGNHYEILRAQTEALRGFMIELSPEQADEFMNMYTQESSALERDWLAKKSAYKVKEPLNPMLVNSLTFLVTICAIAAAIYYVF